jgi:hypothetical protein
MLRHFATALSILVWMMLPSFAGPKSATKSAPQSSIKTSASANGLDTTLIHKAYLEGDFDHAIELIEGALRYGGPFSHQDSVFIYKHLGVMHAAKYETREKGKAYMMQLLNVEPTAKIMDMYASDMIYMIFKNIKDEFDSSRPLAEPDGKPRPRPEEPAAKSKSYAWVGWTAGAVAVVGGVAVGVHLLSEEEPVKNRRISNEN